MFELIDTQPDGQVQESEYKRLLGFPADYALEGRTRELADEARRWFAANGHPWIYARRLEGIELAEERVRVNGTEFSSRQLHENFDAAEVHGAWLAVVSAGRECEERARQLWQEGKPDEYFFMEMFGSAVVEHLVTVASGRICAWADAQGMVALPHYSPGYSGWDVADQGKLWDLMRNGNGATLPGELTVLDTGMLRPKKSLLALFGLTQRLDKVQGLARLVPCESCALPGCQYRRAAYRLFRPQVEEVRRLQSGAAGLREDAKYSLNRKALRKWSQERLQLTARPGGSIEARFRYDGTTCSNLGRPLAYEYTVMLGAAEQGRRILEARCAPAPGDTGHAQQCEFLNDPTLFKLSIDREHPLLDRPLEAVFEWQRPYSPSGCYCEAGGRLHKWGLVFEVIHFALVQREKEKQR